MDPDRLAAIARKHHIVLLLQFGSTVTGRTHAASDVDLDVLVKERPRSLEVYSEIIADLQSLIPDREVDVALINGADPLFLKNIAEQCRLLYGSTRALQELRIYAFKRYQDHRRFLAMERTYVTRTMLALAR